MKIAICLFALLAVFAFAPLAHANLVINYQIDGGGTQLCISSATSPASCTINSGGVAAQVVTASANFPGTPGLAEQTGDTVSVTSTGTHSLVIWVSAQGFMQPTTNLSYESSLSGTSLLPNVTSTIGLTSCIDTTNGVAGTPATFCVSHPTGGEITNANQTLNGAASTTPDTLFSSVASATPTPYALQQEITFSLQNNSSLTMSTSQALTPVPEPGSILLLGTVLLGVTSLVRKKVAK